jgi:hypothetical protein
VVRTSVYIDAERGDIYCSERMLLGKAGKLVKALAEYTVKSYFGEWIAAAVAKSRTLKPGEVPEVCQGSESVVAPNVDFGGFWWVAEGGRLSQ